jgi:hypothetical protein
VTKPSITVEGAKQLQRALRQVEGGMADLKSAHAEAAKIVERQAEAIAPRRSGRLAASVRSAGQARQGIVRAGKAAVPYAAVIHFGYAARNIAPQPYLYDALDARRTEVIATYNSHVNKLIKKNDLD